MNWHDAFLVQAWSDYSIFHEMNANRYPICHQLHYLQMATEKLAKGFLSKPSKEAPVKKTHFAFARFLMLSKQRADLKVPLGYGPGNSKAYSAYVNSVLPLAEKIQKLAPVGGHFDRVNADYPWTHDDGEIKCPAEYDFPDFKLTDLAKIMRLATDLFRVAGFR
jgi:hypothetical protein